MNLILTENEKIVLDFKEKTETAERNFIVTTKRAIKSFSNMNDIDLSENSEQILVNKINKITINHNEIRPSLINKKILIIIGFIIAAFGVYGYYSAKDDSIYIISFSAIAFGILFMLIGLFAKKRIPSKITNIILHSNNSNIEINLSPNNNLKDIIAPMILDIQSGNEKALEKWLNLNPTKKQE